MRAFENLLEPESTELPECRCGAEMHLFEVRPRGETEIGAGILAFSAVSASAGIACVGLVCWHTQSTYEYPSESRVVVHEDSWKWGPSEKYSFREHEGRGYWKGDTWTDWKDGPPSR